MSVRVTRAELQQRTAELQQHNAEIALQQKKEDEEMQLQERAIIDSLLPALYTAIDTALRYCTTKDTTYCRLTIDDDLDEIIYDGCRASCIQYDGNKNGVFKMLCNEIDYLNETLKKEYDTFLSVNEYCYGPRVTMEFDWTLDSEDDDAQSAPKRARTDNE